ncbi:MAG: hypothetical protein HY043_05285 [Verrucomicrobia bacterium]|nr:hypothetical protein [Verrucomicrobiota bacterium]
MKRAKCSKIEFVLAAAFLGALTGCVGYVDRPRSHGGYYQEPPRPREMHVPPPSVQVEASVGAGGMVIRAENDFYEPLASYGRWEMVEPYGRCWIPDRVDADWRPYSDGYWQRTDAGWYWASEEPWGWATYHYGRWNLSAQFGWYWVPQTQWAPAWVSWHRSGGYMGWAPLHPAARFARGGSLEVDVGVISPRAYVFVEERHFLQPVRRSTVVVNNTTIINNTVNITNTKIVNNTVINEGPRTQIIEQASGRKVQAVPVHELRRKQEAEVVARQRTVSSGREQPEKGIQAPVRREDTSRDTKAQPEPQRRAKESEAKAQEQLQRSARDAEKAARLESQRRARQAEVKAQAELQRKAQALEKKTQRVSEQPAKGKPAASEKGATKLLKKDTKKKGEEPQTRREKPTASP